jgi:hypothetical protein
MEETRCSERLYFLMETQCSNEDWLYPFSDPLQNDTPNVNYHIINDCAQKTHFCQNVCGLQMYG